MHISLLLCLQHQRVDKHKHFQGHSWKETNAAPTSLLPMEGPVRPDIGCWCLLTLICTMHLTQISPCPSTAQAAMWGSKCLPSLAFFHTRKTKENQSPHTVYPGSFMAGDRGHIPTYLPSLACFLYRCFLGYKRSASGRKRHAYLKDLLWWYGYGVSKGNTYEEDTYIR